MESVKKKWLVAAVAILALTAMWFVAAGNEGAVTAGTNVQRLKLVPCGNTIGIKIESNGVVVVGTMDFSDSDKASEKFRKGDVIVRVGETEIKTTDELKSAIEGERSETVNFGIIRDGKEININIKPGVNPIDGSRIIGAWVRDSAAGIGTMTWYEPSSGRYGALGHGITDVDTGSCYEVERGEIVRVSVGGVSKGEAGMPGIILGDFLEYEGTIDKNFENGIYGYVENKEILDGCEPIDVASANEITIGEAEIMCCTEGTEVEKFSAVIEKKMKGSGNGSKNLVIRITDGRLLEKTGGIVQGMSGSPIIQNGKLVGAVTHVFVNDPTRGYGIFIENMLTGNAVP